MVNKNVNEVKNKANIWPTGLNELEQYSVPPRDKNT